VTTHRNALAEPAVSAVDTATHRVVSAAPAELFDDPGLPQLGVECRATDQSGRAGSAARRTLRGHALDELGFAAGTSNGHAAGFRAGNQHGPPPFSQRLPV
jgi:hypothetical protein